MKVIIMVLLIFSFSGQLLVAQDNEKKAKDVSLWIMELVKKNAELTKEKEKYRKDIKKVAELETQLGLAKQTITKQAEDIIKIVDDYERDTQIMEDNINRLIKERDILVVENGQLIKVNKEMQDLVTEAFELAKEAISFVKVVKDKHLIPAANYFKSMVNTEEIVKSIGVLVGKFDAFLKKTEKS